MKVFENDVLCVDKINRSTNAHNFRGDVVNYFDTTSLTQPRKNNLKYMAIIST